MAETLTLDALCEDIRKVFSSCQKKEESKGKNYHRASDESCTSFNFSDQTENYSVIVDVRKMDKCRYKEELTKREGEQTVGVELQIEGEKQIGENI